jgi:hypothetical protein
MYMAPTRHLNARPVRLMCARSAKRWGRWFVFAWFAMWVSTALLPCCEVAAAVAAHEQMTHSDCGHPDGGAPDSGGSQKHAPCLDIAAPAPASGERPAAGGNPAPLVPAVSASSCVLPPLPGLSLPLAYRAAPPPVAVYLRSLRLLI